MSLNDDNLRLLSDAEREAMEDDDKYDPDTDNAAALAALGRFPLDAEVEEESNDDAADAGNGMSGYRPGAHDGGPRGEAARQCRVRAHRWQRSVHRVQRAQRESRAPGHSHEEHGRHGAGQVHAGRGLDHVLVRIRQHSVQPGVRRHEPGRATCRAPCCSCPPRRWLASRPRCSATSGATPAPSTRICAASAGRRAPAQANGPSCGSICSWAAAPPATVTCTPIPRTAPRHCRGRWTRWAQGGWQRPRTAGLAVGLP